MNGPLLKYKSFNGKSMHKYPLAKFKNYALKFGPTPAAKQTTEEKKQQRWNIRSIHKIEWKMKFIVTNKEIEIEREGGAVGGVHESIANFCHYTI